MNNLPNQPHNPDKIDEARQMAAFALGLKQNGITRSPQFKRAQLARLQKGLGIRQTKRWFVPSMRLAVPAFATMALFGGITYAAQSSLPGSSLYGIKRATENVIVAIKPSFGNTIAVRRSEEALKLSQKGSDPKLIQKTVDDYLVEIRQGNGNDAKSSSKSLNNLDAAQKTAAHAEQTSLNEAAKETEARTLSTPVKSQEPTNKTVNPDVPKTENSEPTKTGDGSAEHSGKYE